MINQEEIHRMAQSEDAEKRKKAVNILFSNFAFIPDKQQAWSDLLRLTQDKDKDVRNVSTFALTKASPHVPDKNQAWSDLHRLIKGKDKYVWIGAVGALGSVFPYIPDKYKAWATLHGLTQHADEHVRMGAADALDSAFAHVPDKNQAWFDLIRLTTDIDIIARVFAVDALGMAFPYALDKEQAWSDLHQLTLYEDKIVRRSIALVFGSAFSSIPEKGKILTDLHRLTKDEDKYVRSATHYSIGRINALKASETNETQQIKKYLDIAIENFNEAPHSRAVGYLLASRLLLLFWPAVPNRSRAAGYSDKINQINENPEHNPALFCYPFYKTYSTILFEPEKSELEIKKFIKEAKKASAGSESKAELLEAVENLLSALKEADSYKTLSEQKRNLKTYMSYLDRTAEIIEKHKEKTPIPCLLLERGVKTTEERINVLILEIQDKAKKACQQSRGTPTEEIACAANQEIQKWRIGDQEQMTQRVENLIFSLKSKIPFTSENKHIHDKIEEVRKEKDMTKQYEMLAILIAFIPTATVHIGDNIAIKDVTTSGKNIQVVVKGDEDKNINENVSIVGDEVKKSWIEQFNSPATIAAFIGFVTVEIGTYFYPITYNHIIGVVIAVVVFVIVSTLNKR